MVKLVHIADSRLSKLEHCQQLREFEEECTKVSVCLDWVKTTSMNQPYTDFSIFHIQCTFPLRIYNQVNNDNVRFKRRML